MNFEKIINFINNKYHHKRIVKFINRDKITKLIDVGTHKGEFLQDFLKFKSIKTVYAFEPQIEIFKILSKNLKEYEHIEIFNIIKKGGIHYTENSNGIFINLNKLPIDLLLDLNKHVSYYVNNKDLFNMETNKRDNIKKIIKETFPQENFTINEEIYNDEPVINVNKGIEYVRENEIDQNELYYAESIIDIP